MKTLLLIIVCFLTAGVIIPKTPPKTPDAFIQHKISLGEGDLKVNDALNEFSKATQDYQMAVIEYGSKKDVK